LRRLLAVFVLFTSLSLVAAGPKSPTPAPTPTPAPVPALPAVPQPVVLVYPFDEPPDLDPRYGGAVANIYAQVLSQTGGVKVLAIPTGIKREDYQKFAHVEHADYYISGYIEPIGQSAAIVTQVVDVTSSISVYSATTQISDVPDIASQALNARTVILEAAGVARPEIADNGATPTPQASGTTSGASVPITNVLGDLFKGKGKSKGKATPSPSPTPAKPPRGVIIAHLGGNAPAGTLNAATGDLYRAMNAYYTTTMTNVATIDPSKSADAICGQRRDNTIVSGKLDVKHVGGFHAHDSYTFTLNVYACFGVVLYTNTQTNDDFVKAIHDAVEAYNTDHPENDA